MENGRKTVRGIISELRSPKIPLTLPLPCGGRECRQQNLWTITKKHHPSGWCFLFGMSRAGLNSLPRPARSALNQEVRQGSCEWLRHSWDAGSESSLVTFFAFAVCEAYKQQNLWAITKKKHHMHCIFYERSGFVNRAPSGRAAPSVKTDKRTG